jgi:hypothetical protein
MPVMVIRTIARRDIEDGPPFDQSSGSASRSPGAERAPAASSGLGPAASVSARGVGSMASPSAARRASGRNLAAFVDGDRISRVAYRAGNVIGRSGHGARAARGRMPTGAHLRLRCPLRNGDGKKAFSEEPIRPDQHLKDQPPPPARRHSASIVRTLSEEPGDFQTARRQLQWIHAAAPAGSAGGRPSRQGEGRVVLSAPYLRAGSAARRSRRPPSVQLVARRRSRSAPTAVATLLSTPKGNPLAPLQHRPGVPGDGPLPPDPARQPALGVAVRVEG